MPKILVLSDLAWNPFQFADECYVTSESEKQQLVSVPADKREWLCRVFDEFREAQTYLAELASPGNA
jgi:hypothetical protein